jgi:putative hydrolase of the HAD superfamily
MSGADPPVIVLDLDDTLYLERDFVMSGFAVAGAYVHDRFGIDDFAAHAAVVFEHDDRTRVFDVLVADYRLDPALVAVLVDLYRNHAPDIALAPDAARWLQRHRGISRLALITDGSAVTQANKLAALGLDDGGIAPLVCTGAWGREWWKPHPRSFQHVAACYRTSGENCIYVADNPAKDFVAPNALGWRTVQISRPGAIHAAQSAPPSAVYADTVISSFDALDDWLGQNGRHAPGSTMHARHD